MAFFEKGLIFRQSSIMENIAIVKARVHDEGHLGSWVLLVIMRVGIITIGQHNHSNDGGEDNPNCKDRSDIADSSRFTVAKTARIKRVIHSL